MADDRLAIPTGSSGLVTYNVDCGSKLSMSPYFVVFLIILTVAGSIAGHIMFKL